MGKLQAPSDGLLRRLSKTTRLWENMGIFFDKYLFLYVNHFGKVFSNEIFSTGKSNE